MYRTDRFVSWDIGGPLRDSSESMGYALKKAASERGHSITLDDRLMWKLWTIKGPNLPGEAGDYRAWFRAAQALQYDALDRDSGVDERCRELFASEDPTAAVAEIVSRFSSDIPEHMHGPVGDRAKFLFGKDPYR